MDKPNAGEIWKYEVSDMWSTWKLSGPCEGECIASSEAAKVGRRSSCLSVSPDLAGWSRVSAPAPTVRPGQVWEVCDEIYTVACRSKNGLGWDGYDKKGERHPYVFSDGEAESGVVTLVSDAPETVSGKIAVAAAVGNANEAHSQGCSCYRCARAATRRLSISDMTGPPAKPSKYAMPFAGGIAWDYGTIDREAMFTFHSGTEKIALDDEPIILRYTGAAPTVTWAVNGCGSDPAAADRAIAAKMEAQNAAFHERHKEDIKRNLASMATYSLPDTGACRWQRRR